jgi:thioredoxin reductase (NADPH)
LEAAGVTFDAKSGKITGCKVEQTNVQNIYAVGDVLADLPELTPVAIQAGRLLMGRLFSGSAKKMDYSDIATTVFTPLEYGAIGLSEEDAKAKFGDDLIIYHGYGKHLEWNTAPDRADARGFFKILCDKSKDEKVVGVHILGNNAGEVVQGLGVAMKAGFTKGHLDDTVGIHPTFAEGFTTLTQVKKEGEKLEDVGGC